MLIFESLEYHNRLQLGESSEADASATASSSASENAHASVREEHRERDPQRSEECKAPDAITRCWQASPAMVNDLDGRYRSVGRSGENCCGSLSPVGGLLLITSAHWTCKASLEVDTASRIAWRRLWPDVGASSHCIDFTHSSCTECASTNMLEI